MIQSNLEPDRQLASIREELTVKLALLNCASQSYRFETALRPFPPQFRDSDQTDSVKDIEALRQLLNRVCSEIVKFVNNCSSIVNSQVVADAIDDRSENGLLRWLLCGPAYSLKRQLPLALAVDEIEQKISGISRANRLAMDPLQHRPSLVYSVHYNERIERRFQELRSGKRTFYGYHGSRADNLHSILSHGLHAHLSYGRQPLYGEGVYLSTDLGIALAFASAGLAQPLGDRLQCVVVGEVIDQPDLVKRRRRRQTDTTSIGNANEATVEVDDDIGDLPAEYYVVSSSELVIVRYVLLFSANEPRSLGLVPTRPRSASVFHRNKTWILAVAYLLLLMLLPRLHSWLAAYVGGIVHPDTDLEDAATAAAAAAAPSASNSDSSEESMGWGVDWGAD